MLGFTGSLFQALKRPVLAYLVTLSLSLLSVCSLAIYALEHPANPRMHTLFDAAYYTVTIMTSVGLGDIVPVTPAGRALSMAMMLLGTALFVSFTAVLSVVLLEIELQHRAKD
jgi:voltage-gated potassium channel